MTKLTLGAGAALLIAILAAYFLIPSTIVFSKVSFLNVTAGTAERAFYNQAQRMKWWPVEAGSRNTILGKQGHKFEDDEYEFPDQTYSGSTVIIHHGKQQLRSTIHFVSFKLDSIAIKWKSEFPAATNPFKKISNYIAAMAIKKDMAQILDTLKVFLQRPENLYGLKINHEKVRDTILISTSWTTRAYPTTELIYKKIEELRSHVTIHNGTQTNPPMLNVFENAGEFKNMVAIPVDKALPETNSFRLKRMVAGKILTSMVRGGARSPALAMKQIEKYLDDRKIISPAIPFESLVTDRMQEKDTSKWVTKVYYPIY